MKIMHKSRGRKMSNGQKILISVGILLLGIALGAFSKYLDGGRLPFILREINDLLDINNFLGGFAPWILLGLCLSVFSRTPLRAAVNTFLFFAGMVSAYYLYSYFVLGFYPERYAFIWIVFTLLSPFLAFGTWFSKEKGVVPIVISAFILALLINTAFNYGLYYIEVTNLLNALIFIAAAVILKRNASETSIMLALALILAIIMRFALPYQIW